MASSGIRSAKHSSSGISTVCVYPQFAHFASEMLCLDELDFLDDPEGVDVGVEGVLPEQQHGLQLEVAVPAMANLN